MTTSTGELLAGVKDALTPEELAETAIRDLLTLVLRKLEGEKIELGEWRGHSEDIVDVAESLRVNLRRGLVRSTVEVVYSGGYIEVELRRKRVKLKLGHIAEGVKTQVSRASYSLNYHETRALRELSYFLYRGNELNWEHTREE